MSYNRPVSEDLLHVRDQRAETCGARPLRGTPLVHLGSLVGSAGVNQHWDRNAPLGGAGGGTTFDLPKIKGQGAEEFGTC